MSPYLCEDLIAEMFERLPVKFLLRFRSLSKSWRSRIDSPNFTSMYNLRSMKTSSRRKVWIRQIAYGRGENFIDFYGWHSLGQFALCHGHGSIDISTRFPFNKPRVVNSCNGILCLVESKRRIILWNPSIRRKLTIPDHPYSGDDVKRPFIAAGLGLDPITNDYKIVSISDLKNKRNAKNSFVYSVKTRSWYPIAHPATPFYNIRSTACSVNGALHWVAYSRISGSLDHYIMTFNLSTHVFSRSLLPKLSCEIKRVTILNNCLFVISRNGDDFCASVERG